MCGFVGRDNNNGVYKTMRILFVLVVPVRLGNWFSLVDCRMMQPMPDCECVSVYNCFSVCVCQCTIVFLCVCVSVQLFFCVCVCGMLFHQSTAGLYPVCTGPTSTV